jgi:signal transduction histidine kinase
MGRFRESENYQSEAYEISSSLGDMGMMATIKTNLGKLYLQQKQYEKALKSFQESLVLAREINSLPAMQESYKNLSDYYTMRGEYKQALRLFKLQSAVTDSIMSREGLMQIKELELQFNARALEQEIELLKKDNEIQRLSRTRLQYGIILLVILILALSLLFIGYYQRNQYKKKTARLLEEKNEQLEKANRQLQESEKHLMELNSTKDKFFSIIGHDLRNPLNALLGFSELISGNSKEYTTEEIRKYSKIINEAAKNIHLLIENLLEWSRSQSGKIDFNPLETAFAPIMLEIISIFEIQAEKKGIILESDIPEGLMVYADVNLLSTILRNLVNNAVKFTPKNGKVNLDAVQSEQGLRVTIRDTGVGMTKEQLDSLFSLAHGPSTPGTAEEKGTGLGLILCKEFVDKHKGTISAESEPGKGSTFTLVLPNKNQPEA